MVRLDRVSLQPNRIERDQQILRESRALYVRYYLTVTAPRPEADQEAARALGQERFQAFIDQVGRRIAGGRTLAGEVLGRTYEEESEPVAAPTATRRAASVAAPCCVRPWARPSARRSPNPPSSR